MASRVGFLATLALALGSLPAWAQAAPEVGIVTTLQGQATVSRSASPVALALKFKDSIFERDKINTAENSTVKVLMGGKAVVTVRELSVLTITEDMGKTTVNLESGKIAVAVARQRMKPGDRLEVHTPNAVAAVRGTVFLVEVKRQGAQVGGGSLGASTQVTSVSGTVEVGSRANPANSTLLNAFQTIGITGGLLGAPGTLTPQQMSGLLSQFHTDPQLGLDHQASGALTQAEQKKLEALAAALVSDPQQDQPLQQAPVTPCTVNCGPPPAPPSNKGVNVMVNGNFEAGTFLPGWTLSGAGKVISNLGNPSLPGGFAAPEGQFMAFITSGPGSVPGSPSAAPVANITQFSSLTQSFQAAANTLYTIKATVNFVSNEYPFWSGSGTSAFNDFFDIRLKAPTGQMTKLTHMDVNTAFTQGQVSQQVVNVAGFSAGGSCATCGWGYTDFKTLSFSWLSPGDGLASLLFEIGDVGDFSYASGVMIDEVSVAQDPPLYLLQGGATLTRTGLEPLVEFQGGSQTFDSAMVVAAGSTASLAGALLRATNTDLTVPVSLLTVLPGGSFTSSTTDPLVSLTGGTHAIGTDVAMFDLAGSAAAVDTETGLTLATDRPLSTGGVLFQADGGTIVTRQAVKVDAALLEATAPLIALFKGSEMTTATDAIGISGGSKVTGAGSLLALDASRMTAAGGALVNVAGGSVLKIAGDLVSLRSGSTLTILNGPLLFVSGGSIVNISGALVAFGGTGGNILSVSNTLCGGSCMLIGGIPVALKGGATAANVLIGAGAIKNAALGSITLGSASTALILVTGPTSKVTIAGSTGNVAAAGPATKVTIAAK